MGLEGWGGDQGLLSPCRHSVSLDLQLEAVRPRWLPLNVSILTAPFSLLSLQPSPSFSLQDLCSNSHLAPADTTTTSL
jgi:hypothetical protein